LYYVGIDNGLDGGIAIIGPSGNLVDLQIMPTESNGKRRRTDPLGVRDIICNYPIEQLNVVYEKVSGSKSALAAASMADSFSAVEAVLRLSGIRREPVTARTWQKQFWTVPKMAKGAKFDTKSAALKSAKQLWPHQDWRKSERSKKPHDGLVDAALIAEYARRTL